MKLTKPEKIWLIAVICFYAAYNLPFFPAYGDARGALLQALFTLIPLWITVYLGMHRIFRIRKIRHCVPPEEN